MPKSKAARRLLMGLEGFVAAGLLWWLAWLLLDDRIVPGPLAVLRALPGESGIPLHIAASLGRIGAGLLLALAVGLPIGLVMGSSKKWNAALGPIVYFTYPIPKTALLPVAMLLWGMRDGSKIAILFLILVFQVIVAARDGVMGVDPSVYRVAKSLGASRARTLYHVTLPAVLPSLLTSIRVSLGTAASVLFFIEGYGTRRGLGYYILDAWSRIDYIHMYLGIAVLAVVGFFLFLAVDLAAGALCRWSGDV